MSNILGKQLLAEIEKELSGAESSVNKTEFYAEVLKRNSDLMLPFYGELAKPGNSISRKIKNFFLVKIGNIARQALEKVVLRQQRANFAMQNLIGELIAENRKLKGEIEKYRSSDSPSAGKQVRPVPRAPLRGLYLRQGDDKRQAQR